LFLSACIELLFADEAADFPRRIDAARRAGLDAVEFWGWRGKDIGAIRAAARSAGVEITSFLVDPPAQLTSRSTHANFLDALHASCALANKLETRKLIVLAGDNVSDVPHADQRANIIEGLARAAAIAAQHEVTLVLEPLNTRIDHPGHFLDSTTDAAAITQTVGSSHLKLLYDVYHSVTMGEDLPAVVAEAAPFIGHIHVADSPGRHEPGTGQIDWSSTIAAIARSGYDGAIGLEYLPTTSSSESLTAIRKALRDGADPPHPVGRPRERISG
jgi:hydroxypyruvate isomerase